MHDKPRNDASIRQLAKRIRAEQAKSSITYPIFWSASELALFFWGVFLWFILINSFEWIFTSWARGNILVLFRFLFLFLNTESAWGDLSIFPLRLFASSISSIDVAGLLHICLNKIVSLDHLANSNPATSVIFGDILGNGPWFEFIEKFAQYIIVEHDFTNSGTSSNLLLALSFLDSASRRSSLIYGLLWVEDFWPHLIDQATFLLGTPPIIIF